jgi:hypothetical protein
MITMALRPRWLGSEAFRRQYQVLIRCPSTDVSADGSGPEWNPEWRHRPIVVYIFDTNSGRGYRAAVRASELPGAHHPDPDLVYQEIFRKWAVPDFGMEGPDLGESSRADGLQGCDLGRETTGDEIALIPAEKDYELDGLGTLARLPLELRAKIYELAFHRLFEQRFWQCYHTKKTGLTLLGITHSSPLPVICQLSTAIREEVFDSVYREQELKIIIGTELIVANFPLHAMIRPGQEVNVAYAKVHHSKELFIGVQFPAPRIIEGAAAVRSNLDLVVDVLNGIAANQPLPPIRASFHTNAETRNRPHGYFRCDFEIYLGPLRNLRLPLRKPELKNSQVLTIDRLANPKNDAREETCTLIERAVAQSLEDASLLTYRQSMADIKIEMATHNRIQRGWTPRPTYWASTERVAAAAKVLDGFYTAKNACPPPWLTVALDQLQDGGVVADETERQRRLDEILDSLKTTGDYRFSETVWWLEGWTGRPNPFWGESSTGPRYWE